MKYYNSHNAPSISVMTVNKQFQITEITLIKGEGEISKSDFDAIKDNETIRAFVADGFLDFPTDPAMREIYKSTQSERIKRDKELSGEQETRANQPPQDLALLTEMVGKTTQELADTKAFNADLLKTNEDMASDMKASQAQLKELQEQVKALLQASKAKTVSDEAEKTIVPNAPKPPAAPLPPVS